MAKRIKSIGLAASVVLVLSLVLGSAIPVAEGAPAEKVVKVGLPLFITGALGTTGSPGIASAVDFFSSVNDQGGINGVKIDLMWQDTGAAPIVREIMAYKRLKEQGMMLYLSGATAPVEALVPRLIKDEMPCMLATYQTPLTLSKPQWVFTSTPGMGDCAAVGLSWFKENWKEDRLPRVGVFGYDHVSTWEVIDGVKWAAKELGFEYVGQEIIPMLGAVDTSTEWLRLAGKNTDVVYGGACGTSGVVMVKDAKRLGIQESGITLIHWSECVGDTLRVVGRDYDGWYVTKWIPVPTDRDMPMVKIVHEAAKKNNRGWTPETMPDTYLIFWAMGAVVVEGISLALEKVGFESLTSRDIREGLASVEDLDLGFGLPVSMSNARPFWSNGMRMYHIEDGVIQPISDKWYEYPVLLEGLKQR